MPIPYRKTPKKAEVGYAAYLEVLWIRATRNFYGAILLMDARGQPQEFVHNTIAAPSGFLWPEEQVVALGTSSLAHSLFDAIEREPDLLLCPAELGSAIFCKEELAPAIPFARLEFGKEGLPAEWTWVNEPPAQGMRAYTLAQELQKRGFIEEPFERLRQGLKIVYPLLNVEKVEKEKEKGEKGEKPEKSEKKNRGEKTP